MIGYIKGKIAEIADGAIIIENNGIGYKIIMPLSDIEQISSEKNEIKIYTHMHVRDDLLQLFGFLSRAELKLFKLLIAVGGIGPKGAVGLLSAMSAEDISFAVMTEDAKGLAKAPGIGIKTARKLILELKDKLDLEDKTKNIVDKAGNLSAYNKTNLIMSDTIEALTALGYSSSEAMQAVRLVEITNEMTVEDLLKLSLKNL